ncbi:MAG: hypothetical protein NC303_05360 [Firmicutes bacterium]|nr:hypothetical protein [Bacillota bacterium]
MIIINKSAGGSSKISFEKVENCLGDGYEYTRLAIPDCPDPDPAGYDAVAVCGGDGTLSSILSKVYDKPIDLWYFPVGTLNDRAKAERYLHSKTSCPSCGGAPKGKQVVFGRFTDNAERIFAYVFAAGAFTPIGYTAKVEKKKKLGSLAYVGQIFKEYKVHRMNAKIDSSAGSYEGEFSLIMFLKSPRCFGFNFNKAFDEESTSGHLLAIRSPKHDGLIGKIEMFFPFFRAFFIGLKKERGGKIIFKRVYSATVRHEGEVVYCRDGEKQAVDGGEFKIKFIRSLCNFNVIEKF